VEGRRWRLRDPPPSRAATPVGVRGTNYRCRPSGSCRGPASSELWPSNRLRMDCASTRAGAELPGNRAAGERSAAVVRRGGSAGAAEDLKRAGRQEIVGGQRVGDGDHHVAVEVGRRYRRQRASHASPEVHQPARRKRRGDAQRQLRSRQCRRTQREGHAVTQSTAGDKRDPLGEPGARPERPADRVSPRRRRRANSRRSAASRSDRARAGPGR